MAGRAALGIEFEQEANERYEATVQAETARADAAEQRGDRYRERLIDELDRRGASVSETRKAFGNAGERESDER